MGWRSTVAAALAAGIGVVLPIGSPFQGASPCPVGKYGCPIPVNPTRPFTATLTAPTGGSVLSNTVSLSASVAGPGVVISQMQFMVDGVGVGSSLTSPYSATWNTTTVGNGAHTLTATAFDTFGHSRVSAPVTVTVTNGTSGNLPANAWMATNGTAAAGTGNCVWHASPVADPDPTGVTLCHLVKDVISIAGNNPGTVGMLPGTYAAQNPAAPYTSSRTVTLGTCDTTVNRPGGYIVSQNLTSCLTFRPADGGTPLSSEVTINGTVNAYSVGIRFLNITIINGSFGTNWRNGFGGTPCSGPKPHDIIFDGIRNYVTAVPVPGVSPAPGASFNFNSTDNYTVINSDVGPTYDGVGTAQSQDYATSTSGCGAFTQSQIASSGGNIVSNNMHDDPIMVTVTNNNGLTTVNGNQTVAPGGQLAVNGIPTGWPAADFICQNSPACASNKPATTAFRYQYSALGTNTITLVNGGTFADGDHINIQDCGGSGGPSDNVQLACNHAEAIHWRASNANILFNRFTNDGQYDINMQTITGNNTIDGVAVVGNVFDQPCSNQPTLYGAQTPLGVNDRLCGPISSIQAICTSGTDKITNFINAFNTVWGDNAVNLPTGACTGGAAFAGSAWYGNLTAGINSTACGWIKNNGGATDYNFRTTENTGVVCGTHDVASTTPFASLVANPAPTTYDFHLAGTTGSAFAPCSTTLNGQTIVAPTVDIAGTPRPTGAGSCAAGAYELPISTGASLATCTGGTCTAGAYVSQGRPSTCQTTPTPTSTVGTSNMFVWLGNISDGVVNECRFYYLNIPAGLTGSAGVLLWGHGNEGCLDNTGDLGAMNLPQYAATNRLIVVSLQLGWSTSTCTGGRNDATWFHPNADYPDPGSNSPNDYSYIRAVIADLEARMTGSLTVDTKRIWYMGHSSGGGLATGILCDDATSSLLRGVAWQGFGYNTGSTGGSSPAPFNGVERCGGGSSPVATNKHIFVSWTLADTNTRTTGFCPVPSPPYIVGSPSPDGHCVPTFTEANSFLASHFGCNATPTTTLFGAPSAANTQKAYSSCGIGTGTGLMTYSVPGDGDGFNTTDDVLNGSTVTNGWSLQSQVFDFFNNASWTGP